MAPSTTPAASSGMKDTFSRLTPLQKIAVGATILTLAAGTYVLTRANDHTPMAAAYTDLEPQDAAAVTDQLISSGTDYELVDGGRTVLVPADQVYDVRVALSAEGLPGASEGYSLLDRQGITTSEFRQRVDYQRAIEGELARTLRAIDGVESATVHLALPEESVFVDQPAEPTASVLVTWSGTAQAAPEQVNAMVHLVSSSVKGLTPENVTIADSTGRVLSASGSPTMTGAGDVQRRAAELVEQDVGNSLRMMLERVAGPGNVAVTVQADLDLTEHESTTESFDSTTDNGVVVTERTANETYTGADTQGTTGVLGPDGAPVDGSTGGNSESSYTKDEADRTFAVNRTVESTTLAPGTVTRLNVAVLLDEGAVTAEQATAIEGMVSTAAGIDLERGDQVSVTRLPFDTSSAAAAEEAAAAEALDAAAADRTSMIRTAVIGFLMLVALLLAYRSTRRARREVATPIDIGAIRAEPLGGADGAAAQIPPASALPPAPPADPVLVASREALDELGSLADRRPEEVAQILQNWLREDAPRSK